MNPISRRNARPLAKHFDFKEAEPRLYQWWDKKGWFRPEAAPPDAEPFVISIPPPNVTGALHIGHALFCTLEDLMIRYERMRGKAALWLPGSDHAGIATQLQVEQLLREEGTSREEIGYEAFLARTWQWKEQYGGTIVNQLRRLGASCDWERERFTLDAGLSLAVQRAFITLYEQGLVYRGPRLVNWSPGLRTAVSDLEVEREEEDGLLYYFRYPVAGEPPLTVATTRPETILGDTAVAVHPEDARYAAYVGKTARVPRLNRAIPIIADASVDPDFGSGVLKITPAHDFNDYEVGQRHNLPFINVLNEDATMNEAAGPYAGLDRFECRRQLWQDMQAEGLAIREQAHRHAIPRSQRGGEIIEPLLSTQWFVRIQPLARKAIEAVRDGRIQIIPEQFEKVYFHWLEHIEDWCVSRQLWWGHRIPAWYGPGEQIHVGSEPPAGKGWVAETDVLDTWFSSGLWPFSTLGWPDQTADLARFYPTSVLETGYDILFFWVARMIMMGLWFTDEVPFHTVYLHGLVRDAQGRKFSKSLGNVIDPLVLVDRFGADPLRFTLVTSGTPGKDLNLDEARVESNWRFVNKLWQIANFIISACLRSGSPPMGLPAKARQDLPSRWLLSRLNALIANVQRLFDHHQYGEAGRQMYDFVWGEFADWYIEVSKQALYLGTAAEREATLQVLLHGLDQSLRLLHPYMPFVTEEIWQHLPNPGETLMLAPWPVAADSLSDVEAEHQFQQLMDIVRGIRELRREYEVPPGQRLNIQLAPGKQERLVLEHSHVFSRLCHVESVEIHPAGETPSTEAVSLVFGEITLYIRLTEMVDQEAERTRLQREIDRLEKMAARAKSQLADERFVARAPQEVVQQQRDQLQNAREALTQLKEQMAKLR
ncbi:MAG: valine--tRNA ligase [Anaerolineaceae bacterium]|nr:valine--tRNA ligase [Anaerolineaceae bacterium]